MQKEEDNDQHQDHRLDQGLFDVMHARCHCLRRVERDLINQPGWECGRILGDQLARILGHRERIASGKLIDGDNGGGMAVEATLDVVGLRPEFDPGHIPDPHHRSILVGTDDDVGELILRHKTPGRTHRKGHLLPRRHRLRTGLARGIDRILRIHGIIDFLGGDVKVRKLCGIHPQPHRILSGAENRNAGDACQTG